MPAAILTSDSVNLLQREKLKKVNNGTLDSCLIKTKHNHSYTYYREINRTFEIYRQKSSHTSVLKATNSKPNIKI